MRALPASLALLVGSTLGAAPARAKCDYGTPLADRLAAGEIVFRGRLVGMKVIQLVDDYRREPVGTMAMLGEFRVDKVWRGDVGSTISVLTDATSCGAPFAGVGESFVVVANQAGPYVVAHACAGVPRWDEREALARLGPSKIEYASNATLDLAADVAPPGPSRPTLVGAGFLGGSAVASLILAWTASRRRRRVSSSSP